MSAANDLLLLWNPLRDRPAFSPRMSSVLSNRRPTGQYNRSLRARDTATSEAKRSDMERRTQVFGPAYLDRVVRIDRPLIDPAVGPPLDQSVDGRFMFGDGLAL